MSAMIISYTSLVKIQVYWLLNFTGSVWDLLHYVQRSAMPWVVFLFFCFFWEGGGSYLPDYISSNRNTKIHNSKQRFDLQKGKTKWNLKFAVLKGLVQCLIHGRCFADLGAPMDYLCSGFWPIKGRAFFPHSC